MSRYIDSELLDPHEFYNCTPYQAMEIINAVPTADVVEVVRCKDCEYWNNGYGYCNRAGLDCYGGSRFGGNSFCSNGKRRTN